MANRGLEDMGMDSFYALEEYLKEKKKRKALSQSYEYYSYYVAKPVLSNIPQPKRQPVAIIDSNEAAMKYGGVIIFTSKQEIRKPYRFAF